MHKTWSRAEQFRSCKESHQIFPTDGPAPRRLQFSTSFEKEQPAMGLLLGWEYGRLWLKEHKEFVTRELTNAKPVFIDPDFSWWVNKRTAVLDRRQFYLKNKQNPHVKNCNLSAFTMAKHQRQKKGGNTEISGSEYESQKEGKTGSENSSSNVTSKAVSHATTNTESKAVSNVASKALSNGTMVSNAKESSTPNPTPLTNSNSNSESKVKAKKCNCKDCMQRRCGGQEIKSGSYGPDNRKLFYVTRKVLSMPWY
ncbi:uncharacterized protein LOC117788797 [Drosophila innubila]|uniref:uncharacterized protein LOC117788797 n=1 Tax=Drosophila innubila TaxID=198719 RepID=UPI00148BA165|nr:uncharacterized protein LOC117788797 [Drosophila innubila]